MESLTICTIIFDDNARAPNNLTRVALTVNLTKTSPRSEYLGITDLDQVDLVLSTESLDELDVLGLGTGLDKNAEVGLTFVQRLGTLAQTTSKPVVNESILQNLLLQCINLI